MYRVEPDQCLIEGTHLRQVDSDGCCVRCGEEDLLQSIANPAAITLTNQPQVLRYGSHTNIR
jgi:hypothetical protein